MAADRKLGISNYAAPRVVAELLEAAYLSVYAIVGIAFVLHLVLTPSPSPERFWAVVLITDFICFAMLPWIQTRPPRAIEDRDPWRSSVRRLNLRLLGATSIHANTFPSGHAAEAIAAALLVVGAPVPVVCAMFVERPGNLRGRGAGTVSLCPGRAGRMAGRRRRLARSDVAGHSARNPDTPVSSIDVRCLVPSQRASGRAENASSRVLAEDRCGCRRVRHPDPRRSTRGDAQAGRAHRHRLVREVRSAAADPGRAGRGRVALRRRQAHARRRGRARRDAPGLEEDAAHLQRLPRDAARSAISTSCSSPRPITGTRCR